MIALGVSLAALVAVAVVVGILRARDAAAGREAEPVAVEATIAKPVAVTLPPPAPPARKPRKRKKAHK